MERLENIETGLAILHSLFELDPSCVLAVPPIWRDALLWPDICRLYSSPFLGLLLTVLLYVYDIILFILYRSSYQRIWLTNISIIRSSSCFLGYPITTFNLKFLEKVVSNC